MTIADDVRSLLDGAGDRERAAKQRAYMKSAMPYRGLTSPELTTALRPVLRAYRPQSRGQWEGDVRDLWDAATHREEWYAALAVAKVRAARPWRDADCLPLARHLITTGAWWDVVDDIATHVVRDALDADPAEVTPILLAWARDDDPWVRRTAVICQVGRRERIDLDLLGHALEANLDDTTFWLRKAIGWALRDLSGTDPDWVRAFVDAHAGRLSGLSRREALTRLG
ncbi:DNA alkylation repair protein [Nocardioides acrostichi]|uniref:DNA alkylation repair protein n=1 Tax=Nocardioides acrostichi TaxID=2784339 RepID=A0A930UU07_9ACTN|nr:DNA alkylation repair protein [Nocardioides acrostichi]MBF4160166.1 DNA alkylation repair protein [Nocardioides acrostichi]